MICSAEVVTTSTKALRLKGSSFLRSHASKHGITNASRKLTAQVLEELTEHYAAVHGVGMEEKRMQQQQDEEVERLGDTDLLLLPKHPVPHTHLVCAQKSLPQLQTTTPVTLLTTPQVTSQQPILVFPVKPLVLPAESSPCLVATTWSTQASCATTVTSTATRCPMPAG